LAGTAGAAGGAIARGGGEAGEGVTAPAEPARTSAVEVGACGLEGPEPADAGAAAGALTILDVGLG
jgi:hypothetical protein